MNSLAIYMGNPSVHNYGILTHSMALFSHLRTQNRYSATSVDQLPHHLTSLWLYGHKDLLPVPDIDNTQYFLMLGANPIASNGSIWTVPDVRKRITDLKKRGGKLVVLDPRRTETAALANEHHFIRAGSDVLFLAAMLNTLFSESLTEYDRLAGSHPRTRCGPRSNFAIYSRSRCERHGDLGGYDPRHRARPRGGRGRGLLRTHGCLGAGVRHLKPLAHSID